MSSRYRPPGGRGRAAPPPPPPLNHLRHFPNTFDPNFTPHRPFPASSPPRPPWSSVQEAIGMMNGAVAKARRDVIAAGESVSAWKVSQSALLALKADSWESLGFHMQQISSLYRLVVLEGKINALIHCFVEVRKITSLYDLEIAIRENEGVERFEELELGPLLRHPLVVHYFCPSPDVTEVFKITSENIISCLGKFVEKNRGKKVKPEELLDYIAKKQSVKCKEELCIRIQSLGLHIGHIWKARRSEFDALKNSVEGLKIKSDPSLASQEKNLDGHLGDTSKHEIPLLTADGGEDLRYRSASSEDDRGHEDGDGAQFRYKLSLEGGPSVASGSTSCDGPPKLRYAKNISLTILTPYELHKSDRNKIGPDLLVENTIRVDKHTMMFISTWKEPCFYNNADEVLPMMLASNPNKEMRRLNQIMSSPPYAQLLELTVISLKCGMWDSMYDAFQTPSYTCSEKCTHHVSVGLSEKNALVSPIKDFGCQHAEESQETRQPGLGGEMDGCSLLGSCNACCNKYSGPSGQVLKLDKLPKTKIEKVGGGLLIDSKTEISMLTKMFILAWREACVDKSVDEVLNMMLDFHGMKKRKKKLMTMLYSYPAVGLLNVAITSLMCGMWDGIYETSQIHNEQGRAMKYTDYENLEAIVHPLKPPDCVTVEDIFKKVYTYFELHHDKVVPLENKFFFLRKLCGCERWLTEQFSVKDFESLGYGEFFKFLEKFTSLLPDALQKFFSGDPCEKPSLEACMLQHQLVVLLSQASYCLGGNENLCKQNIYDILTWQFPSICFTLVENGSMKDFQASVRGQKSDVASSCVLFSATLFGFCCAGTDKLENDIQKSGPLGSFTTADAIEVLVRAPTLTDLDSWSHWDLLFAPSLGPLVGWLLKDVNTKELLCLVTKGGKVMRIDQSATVDSFLEACLQGSSFQAAARLLSLISLYGGKQSVPLALLKCHTKQAFEVITQDSMHMDVADDQKFLMHREPQFRLNKMTTDLKRNRIGVDKSQSVASRFILDCLGYLPAEFRSFAADVLLSGLRSVVKDANSVILNACNQTEERLMLHEVGMSLGVMEWINDYHTFCSSTTTDLFMPTGASCLKDASPKPSTTTECLQDASDRFLSSEGKTIVPGEECMGVVTFLSDGEVTGDNRIEHLPEIDYDNNPTNVIQTIRREEFGLDSSLSVTESCMLKKQHARLGRALLCLSQELYSHDSHFILELVQNADDNIYPGDVVPTLAFILLEGCIVVLNNEQGFSAENIRALCDVGNSTKKGSSAGYIGKKGIGFKSVFRVSDAPEIHSNGFHIKFDLREGQIGFVLPTVIPPCEIDLFSRLASADTDQMDNNCWNTCILLPLSTKLSETFAMKSIISLFSDLHPSLLLFLHRVRCIKFRNMLNDTMIVMRKEVFGDGIITVSLGEDKMTWFVVSQELRAAVIRPGVQTTEVALAFTLKESGDGSYVPHLDQQPVFAFLPLRTYGLRFIVQGDFILPSSREEVDGDSPWNQWLLSEVPGLFVSAERSFCGLPCFRENPGKAVAAFMSFVPLVGDVHGFFSSLPRMVISKLRMSNCLLMEGDNNKWVPPSKVLRGWAKETRSLLPDSLLREHLGIGFLNKDITLSDSLANALGIEEYGPKVLLQIISSLCRTEKGLASVGLDLLSSWLNGIYKMSFHVAGEKTDNKFALGSDLLIDLRKLPFIPLTDGNFGSVGEGTIWLHSDTLNHAFNRECGPEAFPQVHAKLRIVSPALFSAAAAADISIFYASAVENITRMLYKIGVQQLSAHEIIKVHILPAISDEGNTIGGKDFMTEYLTFVMLHLQSSCPNCSLERVHLISDLRNKALVLTNYGYKRPAEVPIHFSEEFGNPIDVNKLNNGIDMIWHEVDNTYWNHPITKSLSGGMLKWRNFFQEIGISDFVQVVQTEKSVTDIAHAIKHVMVDKDIISPESIAKDWESQELVHLTTLLSSSGDTERCKYLLEVLDTLWDECFSDKVTGYCDSNLTGGRATFNSSFMSILHDVQWVRSSIDDELHYPKDLFHDCKAVRSVLGVNAPYAVPKVRSKRLLHDIGFKTCVTLADILLVLQVWRRSPTPFRASVSQMSKVYSFIWNEMATSEQKIVENLQSEAFIFVPYSSCSTPKDVVPGAFLSPQEVYWHDVTGCVDQINTICARGNLEAFKSPFRRFICNIYPGLQNFFVDACGVNEIPPLRDYLLLLLQLSANALPSEVANAVFKVFLIWSDGLKSGSLAPDDVEYLKGRLLKMEFTVLPTVRNKWVSLHSTFGLVCWCDDEELSKEFKDFNNLESLYFGEHGDKENETLCAKVSILMQKLGIPALSEIVTREAIYYGLGDCCSKTSLVNWALPYAQRYIYNMYPDRYIQLKQTGFEILQHLQIVVVDELFYRNVIKRGIASKKRFQCNCLLQGNVLYIARESDSHSIFMELSGSLVDRAPKIHLANFLHLITTMAESGSTEEQTELFILNKQQVQKLPHEESIWSLPALPSLALIEKTPMAAFVSTAIDDPKPSNRKKSKIYSNWPPANWKTAPDFGEKNKFSLGTNVVYDSVDTIVVPNEPNSGSTNFSDRTVVAPDEPSSSSTNFSNRDQLSLGTANAKQAMLTGRLGEYLAYEYFVRKVGEALVKWVNESTETGLPYDIVVGDDEENREYIEVKTTESVSKDWFSISQREWQYAVSKGESFSIARVVLVGSNLDRVTIYKNPARLCKLGQLQLAIVMPKQEKESPEVAKDSAGPSSWGLQHD